MKKPVKKQSTPPKSKEKATKLPVQRFTINGILQNQYVAAGILAIILLCVTLIRYRLLSLPLERDEGEYALMGQLILKGIPPYEMAYNMKLPGTYYMYALIMAIFGQSATGIHLGLLIVNLGNILLLFFIVKKLIHQPAALVAAAVYAVLSLSPRTFGFAAHATHFNVLFCLSGFLGLLSYAEKPTFIRLAVSGFWFGLSFIMKQQAIFLMIFGFVSFVLIERKRGPANLKELFIRSAAIGGAMVLPYIFILLSAWLTGSFDKFWHWTVEYARQYVGLADEDDPFASLKTIFPYITNGYMMFWWAGLAGLVTLFFSAGTKKFRWIILLFAISSLSCVVPGLYFRPHYFIIFLPALALLVAVAFNFIQEMLLKWKLPLVGIIPYFFLAFMLYKGIHTYSDSLFKDDPAFLCLRTYGATNPFRESLEIAKFIRNNSNEEDKVAILGSEPQIYFYSNRLPATGYIYTYPLMENQPYSLDMQREMIAEIEKNKPKFLIYINSPFSWMLKSHSAREIFEWNQTYRNQFNLVGIVDLNPSGTPTYVWREDVLNYKAQYDSNIWVYERR